MGLDADLQFLEFVVRDVLPHASQFVERSYLMWIAHDCTVL